jgi:hypothetical protein
LQRKSLSRSSNDLIQYGLQKCKELSLNLRLQSKRETQVLYSLSIAFVLTVLTEISRLKSESEVQLSQLQEQIRSQKKRAVEMLADKDKEIAELQSKLRFGNLSSTPSSADPSPMMRKKSSMDSHHSLEEKQFTRSLGTFLHGTYAPADFCELIRITRSCTCSFWGRRSSPAERAHTETSATVEGRRDQVD